MERGLPFLLLIKPYVHFVLSNLYKVYFPVLETLFTIFSLKNNWSGHGKNICQHSGAWDRTISNLRLIWTAQQDPVGRIKERKWIGREGRREGIWYFILLYFSSIKICCCLFLSTVCVNGVHVHMCFGVGQRWMLGIVPITAHFIYWGGVSHLNPELASLPVVLCSLPQRSPISASWALSYKWAATPTSRFYLGSGLCTWGESSTPTEPSPQPHFFPFLYSYSIFNLTTKYI